ncbi:hypothetical protein [Nocardia altamirensis]|uniref:hypothetical protein n=1 Tax=Nocardia altamirensis TaxID=472158 RepID=UPI0008405EDF|nr:hypothetical protein [Nocardia altamirensis]
MTNGATGPAPSEIAEELSWLDPRLLSLDPDLEGLFAEIDDILCRAGNRWDCPLRREPRTPRPGPGRWWPTTCHHGHRPGPEQGRERGPPTAHPARLDLVFDNQ